MNPVWRIAGHEVRHARRSGVLPALAVLVAVLMLGATIVGSIEQRRDAEQRARYHQIVESNGTISPIGIRTASRITGSCCSDRARRSERSTLESSAMRAPLPFSRHIVRARPTSAMRDKQPASAVSAISRWPRCCSSSSRFSSSSPQGRP